jgi:UDP-N-acetylmuramoyl-tripeptide--D-alanyl-D-alanine ligase
MPLRIREIIQAANGRPINCNNESIVKDMARKIEYVTKGCIFIPTNENIPVTKELIELAHQKGAVAAVIPNEIESSVPQIIVGDTFIAYTKIYEYYRRKFKIPVIAVTGSAGKTSTKDMIALVLQQRFKVCKTMGNDNIIKGTIRTLLSMNPAHGAAVYEMAVGRYARMKEKVHIARPNIAVITNISTAHIDTLGSKENILKAKLEITSFFNNKSILIINNDDEYLSTIKDKPYKIIRVSTHGNGDFNAFDIVDKGENGVEFKCIFKGKPHLFKLNMPGTHFVYSSLISIAIGDLLGLNIKEIKKGLENFKPHKLRMNIIELKDNIKIMVDCYNANLISMKAGIDTLKSFAGNRKIAVLGDIFEQGKYSEEVHREVGKYLAGKCDILIAVGEASKYIYEEAKVHTEAYYFETKEKASLYLEKILTKNDVILLKASRGMEMEVISQHLSKKFANNKKV